MSKYLGDETTLSSKISRISLHSVAKKSTRFSAKLTSTLGMSRIVRTHNFTSALKSNKILQGRDELFEEHERAFYNIEKGIRNFVLNSKVVLEQLNEVVMSQLQNSVAIFDFYCDSVSNNEEYRAAQLYIANELYPQYVGLAHC